MDIIENIDAIGRYTAGLDQQSFTQDAKTRDATITCLMRISEASTKLEKMAEDLARSALAKYSIDRQPAST